MKTLRYSILPLCVAALASCGELNVDSPEAVLPEGPQAEGTVLTATIGPATKTVLGDKDAQGKYKVSWVEGDKINVNGDESAEAVIAEDGKASFSFGKEMAAPFKAVYPSSSFKSVSENAVTVTVPSEQTYKAGTFDASSALMYAAAEDGTALTFHHLMAYLKLSFTTASDPDKIKTVSLKARGAESMSGDFTLDFATGTLAAVSGSKAGSITVDCGEGVDLGTEIIVAVPAQTYASGLEIVTTDVNGDKTTHLLKKEFAAKAGTVYPMPISFELYPGSRMKPITVNETVSGVKKDVVWAPVYCGYSAEHPNGLLYQYGRAKGQPYYPATSSTTASGSIVKSGPTSNPDDKYFYIKDSGDWYSGTSLKSWPEAGDAEYIEEKICDPCPEGWRLPTIAEAQGLVDIGFTQPNNWVNSTPSGTDAQKEATYINNGFTLKGSDLFFPAAGGRTSKGASFYRSYVKSNDEYARMWTSDRQEGVSGVNATLLSIRRNNADAGKSFTCEITSIAKATGISVRCVKAQ